MSDGFQELLLERIESLTAEVKELRKDVHDLQKWRSFAIGAWAAIATGAGVAGWFLK